MGLSTGDALAEQARAVFSRERDQPPGGIEHRHRRRGEIVAACVRNRPVHDRAGTDQVDPCSPRI
jgi:hypothetical protein